MNWKFWRRDTSTDKSKRLSGPKELPQQIGGYLVKKKSLDPDWVWTLKCVVRPMINRNRREFRVFNPNDVKSAGVRILDFYSLENYPELILFDGWYDKNTYEVEFTKETEVKAA